MPSLQILQEVAEALAAQYLESYTADLKAGAVTRLRRKEINDSLWGTVSLSRIEVAVLDSPLLQRLRFLRQMGAAHWVYPGAVHTRFEHAIGALHQTQQLIDSLNAQAHNGDEQLLISSEDAQLLRLSSLFSHVGHLTFSDSAVLELESQSEFATAAKDFTSDDGRIEFGADPSFCQLLAHYIVRSPAVREFLLTLVKESLLQIEEKNDERAVEHVVNRISLAVIGRRIDESRPQLQELVNGPFDASTLDALVRDAKFSGIPSVLDIHRLIQKLAVRSFRLEALPDWINESIVFDEEQQLEQPPVWIFGVPASATPILNELQLAQVLLTTKIRRHPKVLATEQMLRSVVRTLGGLASSKNLLTFLYSTAEDVLIGLGKDSLEAVLRRDPNIPLTADERSKLELAADTLAAIRERRIWVRAFQLSDSAIEADSLKSVGMSRFYDELRHVQRGPGLLSKLCEEVAVVLRATNQPAVPGATLAAQINLRSLQSISAEARIGRAIVLPPSKHPYMLRETWEGADNWVDQYLRGQPTTYVFSTPELADAVYVALERLADRSFKAELPSGTVEASKRSKKDIRTLKQQATEVGFWHGHSWTIRPKAAIFDLIPIRKRIDAVAKKLIKVSTASVDGAVPDRTDATYRWLEQFETDQHIQCALKSLELLQVVERDVTEKALGSFFAQHQEFRNSYVVSFGDPKDGSVIQGNFAASHAEVAKVVTLDQWVREEEKRPLIFVDDFTGSGRQACDILAAWFEREDLRQTLGEERDRLSKAVQEKLRETKIAFLFMTAWDAGLTKIDGICNELGLDAKAFTYISEGNIPFIEQELLKAGKSSEEVAAFVNRCGVIGAQILESTGVRQDKIEGWRFGYGNTGMLLATLLNVPTQTATLIWKSGIADGTHWEALLPRRPKK